MESAVEIARREREERKKRMRFDRPTRVSQPAFRDQYRDTRVYDQSKLPQGKLYALPLPQKIILGSLVCGFFLNRLARLSWFWSGDRMYYSF
jgi:multisubunit Na+/H+ antiporter MnhC subunit